MSCNSSPLINKYISELNEKLQGEKDNFFYAFRGQPSSDFALNCSAVRNDDSADKVYLRDNQVKLISDLRLRGFGFSKESKREFKDLELLAHLRHYGAPSCLIDFTSNFLIALWFACQEEHSSSKKNGKVFILNCYETDKFSLISSETINKSISHFFEDRFYKMWYWIPEGLNQRVTDQSAIFVFGKPRLESDEYKYIEVKQNDKAPILCELEKFFDYTKKTLFSDEYAIGEIYKSIGDHKNLPSECLEDSVYYIQTGDFAKAESLLGKIINQDWLLKENKDLFLEAHFQRAINAIEYIKQESRDGKMSTEEHFNAISNLDKAEIETKPKYIKDLTVCIKHEYKVEDIKKIKKVLEFEFALEPKNT